MEAAERVRMLLRQQMAGLIGPLGFDTLFGRALVLAKSDFSLLTNVEPRSSTGPVLDGLRVSVQDRSPAEVTDAIVAVFGIFISLLINFIGEDLGLRLVHDTWPGLAHGGIGSSQEAKE